MSLKRKEREREKKKRRKMNRRLRSATPMDFDVKWLVHSRHFVPDEVSVYVCEQHRPVGLEVPGAFWNDVVGRGRFSPGATGIRQTPGPCRAEARFPLYRPSPTAPLFSMADGQSYRPSTNCNFTSASSALCSYVWKSSSCGANARPFDRSSPVPFIFRFPST